MTANNPKTTSRRRILQAFASWFTLQFAGILKFEKAKAFTAPRLKRAKPAAAWHFWGSNLSGNFGNTTNSNSSSTPLSVFSSASWTKLVGGGEVNATTGYFTAGIKSNGTLWGFGKNTHGQLGIGNATDISSPVQIGSGTNWADVFGSFCRSNFAIRTDGTLWAWGQNPEGNLGDGTTTPRSSPVQIAGTWTTVAAGLFHTIGIKSDGSLWGWGDTGSGQVGSGSTGTSISSPVQLQSGSTFVKVAAGHSSSFAIRSDGTLWAWGTNGSGQIGLGTALALRYSTPVQVGSLTTWSEVKTGGSAVFAKRTDGTYWSWGYNSDGQLGIGSTSSKSTPVQVPGTDWSIILPSWGFVLGLKNDGTLYAWGEGSDGVHGTGNTTSKSTPVQVPGSWQKIFVSPRHAGGIKG